MAYTVAHCPICGAQEPCWNAAAALSDAHKDGYSSRFAMEAAVELEILLALGRLQTQTIGKIIQRAMDRAMEKATKEAITVWKNGTWKRWAAGDAYYAQNDPNWFCTIPLSE